MIARAATITLLSLLLVCLLPAPVQASGIGVSPPVMEIADAFRGNEYQRAITVFNAGEEARSFTLETAGEIGHWVTFHEPDDPDTPIDSIIVPGRPSPTEAGTARVLVRFRLPEDVANRPYNGILYVTTAPLAEVETDHAVKLQVSTAVVISVTGTQMLRGTVDRITVRHTEIGLPLVVHVTFANTGNVVARPAIDVAITGEGQTLAEFSYSETEVGVDDRQVIELEWDTAGTKAGDYTAQVAVSLAGENIKTSSVPFKILPRGGLAGEGRLAGLSYDQPPTVGTIAKILAAFQNTGWVEVNARLSAEIYRDGGLIDVIESEELLVPAGEEAVISGYFRPDQEGDYLVKGHVSYGGRQTAVQELSFTVGDPDDASSNLLTFAIAGAVGVVLIGGIFIAVRRRRQRPYKTL